MQFPVPWWFVAVWPRTTSSVLLQGGLSEDGKTVLPTVGARMRKTREKEASAAFSPWKTMGQLEPPGVVYPKAKLPQRNLTSQKLLPPSLRKYATPKTTNAALMPAPRTELCRGRMQWNRTESQVAFRPGDAGKHPMDTRHDEVESARLARNRAAAETQIVHFGTVNKCASNVGLAAHIGGVSPVNYRPTSAPIDPQTLASSTTREAKFTKSIPPPSFDQSLVKADSSLGYNEAEKMTTFNPWITTSSELYPEPPIPEKFAVPVRTYSQYSLSGTGVSGSRLYERDGELLRAETPYKQPGIRWTMGKNGEPDTEANVYLSMSTIHNINPIKHPKFEGPKQPHEVRRFQWYRMHSNVEII